MALTLALALLTLAAQPDPAPGKAPAVRVMVLEIPADPSLKPTVVATINQYLIGAVRDQGVEVISPSEIAAVLGLERQRQLLGCSESGCLAELGGAMGVDYIIQGAMAVLEHDSVLTLTLIDHKGLAVASQRKVVNGREAAGFFSAIEVLVPQLMHRFQHSTASNPSAASGVAAPTAGGLVSSDQLATSSGFTIPTSAWVVGGSGAILLGASAVFGVLANQSQKTYEADIPTGANLSSDQSAIKTNAWISTVCLGAGLVALGGGAVMVWLHSGTSSALSVPP